MTDDQVLAEFRAAEALLEGHFILSSGLRSPRYLQCARVLMDGDRAERLARALADKIPAEIRERIDAVVSPAMGGVIAGHEMGRALGVEAMFDGKSPNLPPPVKAQLASRCARCAFFTSLEDVPNFRI